MGRPRGLTSLLRHSVAIVEELARFYGLLNHEERIVIWAEGDVAVSYEVVLTGAIASKAHLFRDFFILLIIALAFSVAVEPLEIR